MVGYAGTRILNLRIPGIWKQRDHICFTTAALSCDRITSENVKSYCDELRTELNEVGKKYAQTTERLTKKIKALNEQYLSYIESRQINHAFVL